MIPIIGMSSFLGLKLSEKTEDIQKTQIRNTQEHVRAINAFRDRIGDIQTVDQLIDDTEVYSFVMRAFDLEDQIFGKALMRKMLKSDVEDSSSLINRLTDSRFRDLFDELGFDAGGTGNANTAVKDWQDAIIDRYVDTQYVNDVTDQNETVGIALEFRRKAADISGPFDILKDEDTAAFMRTVLGLPAASAEVDIDRQAKFIEQAYDLEKLQDPDEVERLMNRYVIVTDALNSANTSTNAVVQLMSGAASVSSSDSFVPVTIDIAAIAAIRGSY